MRGVQYLETLVSRPVVLLGYDFLQAHWTTCLVDRGLVPLDGCSIPRKATKTSSILTGRSLSNPFDNHISTRKAGHIKYHNLLVLPIT